MRHAVALLAAVTLVTLLAGSLSSSRGGALQEEAPAPRLPGARAVVDASRYPDLQAAIDALPSTGGLLRLPPGTFEIGAPLRVTVEDVLIEGSGTATHIRNGDSEGQPALVLEPRDLKREPGRYIWRLTLRNFRLTGNPRSGAGLVARRVNEIFIDGITVSHHGGDGIRLESCYEDPRIVDSLITYNGNTGLHLESCHDIVVAGNQFEENRDALRCIDSFNLCMTGNNLDDHLRDGVVIENTYGSVVAGNMIEECRGRAIVLERDCYGITLSANVIAHNTLGGIDLRDAHGCAVSANTFTIMGRDALVIGPASGRITVTGNNFSDSYIGENAIKRRESDRNAGGLVLRGTRDVAVSGNLFSSVRPRALVLDGEASRRVLFTGNVLTNVESDHGKLEASVIGHNLEARE